jgi:hypothetical protein
VTLFKSFELVVIAALQRNHGTSKKVSLAITKMVVVGSMLYVLYHSRPKVTPIDEVRRRYNCFEYRWHAGSLSYYLFNPWTGETMFNTELGLVA